MIAPETIEDTEHSDGESVLSYGFDPDTGQWGWGWVPIEYLEEAGRTDIIERQFGRPDYEESE